MKYIFIVALAIYSSLLHALTVTSGITAIAGTGVHTNQQMAISTGGKAMAVWVQNFPNQIEASHFNGSSWSSPVILASGSFPQIGVDGNGNAFAIWLNTNNNQIYTSRFNATTLVWSPPILLSTGGVNAAPQIAVNSSGNAIAVWILSFPLQLIAATYTAASSSWSAPVTLVAGTGSFPQVVLDSLNNGIIMWSNTQFGLETITVHVP